MANTKRTVTIHYDTTQINLGDDATADDVSGWLDNLAQLLADEFSADVSLSCTGTWGGHSVCCHDNDVQERLRAINSGDEWLALLPE